MSAGHLIALAGVAVAAVSLAGPGMADPIPPTAIAAAPDRTELLAAYPIEPRSRNLPGRARLACVSAAGSSREFDDTVYCNVVNETPVGAGFGDAGIAVTRALVRMQASFRDQFAIELKWTASDGVKPDDATIGFEKARPGEFRFPTIAARPPQRPLDNEGAPLIAFPDAASCVWNGVGPADRAFVQAELLTRGALAASRVPTYAAAWGPVAAHCNPTWGGGVLQAAGVFAVEQVARATLERSGVNVDRLAAIADHAPMVTQASIANYPDMQVQAATANWRPLFEPLGVPVPSDLQRNTIASYLWARSTEDELAVHWSKPYQVLTYGPGLGDVLGKVPRIDAPKWVRWPTLAELAWIYPLGAARKGEGAHVTVDCVVKEDGSMEECATDTRWTDELLDVLRSCFRIAPRDAAGAPVADRRVRISLDFSGFQPESVR